MKSPTYLYMITAGLLSSCAANPNLHFSGRIICPDYPAGKKVHIMVVDNRPSVLNGREKATWCGHTYSLAHIAYDIQTKTGRAVTDEIADAVVEAFTMKGAEAKAVYTTPGSNTDSRIQILQSANVTNWLLFDLRAWESKAVPGFSTIGYEHKYDIRLQLIDGKGHLLGKTEVHGQYTKKLGGVTSIASMQEMADDLLAEKISTLFVASTVRGHLESGR